MSKDCLDILTHMLVAVPSDRLSMDAIKTHPWFLAGLPPGALDMNEFLLRGMEPFNLSMVCGHVQHRVASSRRLPVPQHACCHSQPDVRAMPKSSLPCMALTTQLHCWHAA